MFTRNVIYRTTEELDFSLDDVPAIPSPQKVLLTRPDHFDVQYVINPHMEGHIGSIDRAEAHRQWKRIQRSYDEIGIDTTPLEGAMGLPDMVFCANQTLPYHNPQTGRRGVIISRMYAEERRDEVDYFEAFFREQGYQILTLPEEEDLHFEGMGDAIWHPGRYLLWGGYGIRTDPEAYEYISGELHLRVLLLHLSDDDFYHLDTCFSVLDERSVLIFPGAFDAEGLGLIDALFERRIEADEQEARELFACNAHCPDGEHVIIQKGCDVTVQRLQEAGFQPIPVETDEFLKAGGSVFCMKQMYW